MNAVASLSHFPESAMMFAYGMRARLPGSDVDPVSRGSNVGTFGSKEVRMASLKVQTPSYEKIPTFDELYRREWRYVAAVADRLMIRKADVRDIVQEVFIKAYRSLDKVENPGAIRGWLATITVRAVSDRLRRKKWQQVLLFQSEQLDEVEAEDASPETQAELRGLQLALSRLPVKERIAWSLRHIEQEPLDEVARLAGCSLATAKRRISAAQDKLRAHVENTTGERGFGEKGEAE
jgi:RNA polymerase sigma-70 factor, ECF subfamily